VIFPQLAYSVDFIAAHVLPYWEKLHRTNRAVDQGCRHGFQLLRDQFPGKRNRDCRVWLAERGLQFEETPVPGPFEQASVLRNFVTPGPKPSAWITISSRQSISRGKFFEGGRRPLLGDF